MSHFLAYVFVPDSVPDDAIEFAVEHALAPFDENTIVESYPTECYCIGGIARQESSEEADRIIGKTIDDYRKEYHIMPKDNRPPWEEFIQPWLDVKDERQKSHPLYQKPDPTCEECEGKGTRYTTYNPDSKWDWWRIGGRWDGVITGKARDDEEGGFNFGEDHEQLHYNMVRASELLQALDNGDMSRLPFALIDANGEWHQRGEMGWFGMASNEKEDDSWENEFRQTLQAHPNHFVVACDLHI